MPSNSQGASAVAHGILLSMENAPRAEYVSPEESLEREGRPDRRIDLLAGAERIGSATMEYRSKPVRHFEIGSLYVEPGHQGQGNAGRLIEAVERFLVEAGKPGLLVDAIIDGSPAQGMYARRGWREVPGSSGLLVFNWPDGQPLSTLDGYSFRYTDPMERNSPAPSSDN